MGYLRGDNEVPLPPKKDKKVKKDRNKATKHPKGTVPVDCSKWLLGRLRDEYRMIAMISFCKVYGEYMHRHAYSTHNCLND